MWKLVGRFHFRSCFYFNGSWRSLKARALCINAELNNSVIITIFSPDNVSFSYNGVLIAVQCCTVEWYGRTWGACLLAATGDTNYMVYASHSTLSTKISLWPFPWTALFFFDESVQGVSTSWYACHLPPPMPICLLSNLEQCVQTLWRCLCCWGIA